MAVHEVPADEAERHQLDERCPCRIRVEPVLRRRDMTWREHWIHQSLASQERAFSVGVIPRLSTPVLPGDPRPDKASSSGD